MWCVIVNDISTEIWHKALLLCKDKPEWCGISHLALVIEICLCTPCSNAMLERFFNHLKVVKTDQRASLSSSSLNSILPIQLWQIPITHFMKNLLTNCVPLEQWQIQEIEAKEEKAIQQKETIVEVTPKIWHYRIYSQWSQLRWLWWL